MVSYFGSCPHAEVDEGQPKGVLPKAQAPFETGDPRASIITEQEAGFRECQPMVSQTLPNCDTRFRWKLRYSHYLHTGKALRRPPKAVGDQRLRN
jgi:hypothetical protein